MTTFEVITEWENALNQILENSSERMQSQQLEEEESVARYYNQLQYKLYKSDFDNTTFNQSRELSKLAVFTYDVSVWLYKQKTDVILEVAPLYKFDNLEEAL